MVCQVMLSPEIDSFGGRDDSRRLVLVLLLHLGLLGHPLRGQGLPRLQGRGQARAPGVPPADTLHVAGGFPARGESLLGDAEGLDGRRGHGRSSRSSRWDAGSQAGSNGAADAAAVAAARQGLRGHSSYVSPYANAPSRSRWPCRVEW
jgi:hypothetical protein